MFAIFNFDNPWTDNKSDNNKSNFKSSQKNFLDEIYDSFKKNAPNLTGMRGFWLGIALLLIIIFVGSGLYLIEPNEIGVIVRFGKYDRISGPGLHWKIPAPIEQLDVVNTTRIRREHIGFQSVSSEEDRDSMLTIMKLRRTDTTSDTDNNESLPSESYHLTGDENVVDLRFFVQWKISNPVNYIFKIKNTTEKENETVKLAAQSAMRQVIGVVSLYDALSERRSYIEQQTHNMLQDILNSYESGIEVVSLGILYSYVAPEVRDAYRDVQAAKADQQKLINQAEAYRNDALHRAKGNADEIEQHSLGYKESTIKAALGEKIRFELMQKQYAASKNIIKTKMYMDAVQSLLANNNKIITGKDVKVFLSTWKDSSTDSKTAMKEEALD
ncbi:Modulator of FtsH protease HflK [Candidatus Fokinia solitaria]|uniref:Protein HflK n=1 Tax=Candidatus Fokinia solitaria TaxID=1802984 RepID=A0A2U8BRM9_9RICK|nr:FtsH protease activity modulator HflK [Candidatus Fokinia solitaria]AWD32987.1 Modulator of FtsH protease HflK [Candidatus Fokinia solitaria]